MCVVISCHGRKSQSEDYKAVTDSQDVCNGVFPPQYFASVTASCGSHQKFGTVVNTPLSKGVMYTLENKVNCWVLHVITQVNFVILVILLLYLKF